MFEDREVLVKSLPGFLMGVLVESQHLSFPGSFLLMCIGSQQVMVQVPGPLPPGGAVDPDGVPGPSLAAVPFKE